MAGGKPQGLSGGGNGPFRGGAVNAIGPAAIVAQGQQLALNGPNHAAAIAALQGAKCAAQLSIGAAYNNHPRAIGHSGVKLLCILHPHADAPMAGIGTNAFRPVGAVDAVVSPGHVQPQKAGAEAAHFTAESAGDAENAQGRGGFPCAGGHGVLLHLHIPLEQREGLGFHIDEDLIGRFTVGGQAQAEQKHYDQQPFHAMPPSLTV